MSLCKCAPSCRFDGAIDAARSFAALKEEQRAIVVRGMLLAEKPPSGSVNYLKAQGGNSRKRCRAGARKEAATRCCVQYAFQGRVLCSFLQQVKNLYNRL